MPKGTKPKIAIVDFHMGNLFSVMRACEYVDMDAVITYDSEEILKADGLILPGVGAFGDAMRHLEELKLIEPIKDFIKTGKPFFGICLGMQLLMSQSEEFGIHDGLDVISGKVIRFSNRDSKGHCIKVPQVGWNQIYPGEKSLKSFREDSFLQDIQVGEYMYFVHSFYVKPDDDKVIASLTNYEDIIYCSGIQWKNIFAVQFHPEKSAKKGIQIYRNWKNMFSSPVLKK